MIHNELTDECKEYIRKFFSGNPVLLSYSSNVKGAMTALEQPDFYTKADLVHETDILKVIDFLRNDRMANTLLNRQAVMMDGKLATAYNLFELYKDSL